jgi:threonine/homoserine/homoserine lactone efflux protein
MVGWHTSRQTSASVIEASTLLIFVGTVLVLFLSPGPNMFFVLSYGMAHGRAGGLFAALGIVLADLVLTLLTATGITALIAAWQGSFDVLRWVGAAYLLWLAYQALQSGTLSKLGQAKPMPRLEITRRAMLNSLLNPKALLFFMLFLPQFVHAQDGNVGWQLLTLGLTLTAVSVFFHAALGILSGAIGRFLQRNQKFARIQGSFLAVAMTLLALRLVLLERPQ